MCFLKSNLIFVCVLISFLSISRGQHQITDRPSVNITNGQVIGWYIESKSTAGKIIRAFKGIPFAKPPINELRFLDPLPVENWTEAKSLSLDDPVACPQPPTSLIPLVIYNEDCLFVNVFTPEEANASSLLPVMVSIYGGGFIIGASNSSMYGGDYLVDQGVIFVSMNYRVGVLGFLNLGTDSVPGNAGLKDQLLALQWVQSEITKFGGDPSKVTVFGESAGAASVIFHYLSPRTANLFSYAIAESGNALAEWTFLETGFLDRAKSLSANLNCPLINDTVQLSCLQSAMIQDLVIRQFINISDSEKLAMLGLPFVPSLEKPSATAFLSDTPLNLLNKLSSSTGSKRPLITGVNKEDGLLAVTSMDANYYTMIYSNLQYLIPEVYRNKKSAAEIESDVALIKTEYFNNTPPSLSNLQGFMNMYTDTLFALSTVHFARQIASTTKVYLYQFEYNGAFNLKSPTKEKLNLTNVVGHGDELGYIYYRFNLNQSKAAETSPEKKTLNRMVKMWTNFAKSGNPTPENPTDNTLENFIWSPITNGSYQYMRVTDQLNMSTGNLKEEALTFWNKIESTSFGTKISCSFALISVVITFFLICNLEFLYT